MLDVGEKEVVLYNAAEFTQTCIRSRVENHDKKPGMAFGETESQLMRENTAKKGRNGKKRRTAEEVIVFMIQAHTT